MVKKTCEFGVVGLNFCFLSHSYVTVVFFPLCDLPNIGVYCLSSIQILYLGRLLSVRASIKKKKQNTKI